ncbi:TPA: hypothetical protein NHT78_000711 [Morganella morganii]|nr:hypothetical protein [Morganella morganii]
MDDFLNRLEKHTWFFRAGCYGMGLLSVALIFLLRSNLYLIVPATGAMAVAFYLFMLHRQSVLTLLSAALFMSGGILLFCGLAVLRPEFLNDLLIALLLLITAMVVYWLTRYREKQLTMQMMSSPVTTATLDILMSVAVAADIHDAFCDYVRTVPKPVTIGSATDWLTAEQKRRQR